MARLVAQRLAMKRTALVERTAAALGVSSAEAAELLRVERRQSLRVNPLQGELAGTLKVLAAAGWRGKPYAWMPEGYSIDCPIEVVRDSVAIRQGRVFIQNAASWLPVLALNVRPGDTVLDVCAAPGGKTSHIAAVASNAALITANDNSRSRLAKLRANLERLGVQGVATTLYDASYLAKKLVGRQFDKVLLDAPCSGEGLMNLDRDKDFETWSVAQIKRLQQLQRRLIGQAWQLVKPGGVLVYSTCTMAPEENEAVVDYLLRRQADGEVGEFGQELSLANRVPVVREWNGKVFDSRVERCMRLEPSAQIEAFFVAKMMKRPAEEV